jgi:hypothetical protein
VGPRNPTGRLTTTGAAQLTLVHGQACDLT